MKRREFLKLAGVAVSVSSLVVGAENTDTWPPGDKRWKEALKKKDCEGDGFIKEIRKSILKHRAVKGVVVTCLYVNGAGLTILNSPYEVGVCRLRFMDVPIKIIEKDRTIVEVVNYVCDSEEPYFRLEHKDHGAPYCTSEFHGRAFTHL